MKSMGTLALITLLGLAMPAFSGVVTLTDGSSLSGELKEQDNGDVIVVTGAGEVTVAKDKIKTIIKDGSASSSSATPGDMQYINKVLEKRQKYGNEDGIPRSNLLLQRQIAFSLGMLNYSGDALNFASGGTTLAQTSDYNGLHYGLGMSQSFNDISGWELWSGYSQGEKGFTFTTGGQAAKLTLHRADIAFLPRLQKSIQLGDPEQSMNLLPHFGLGPIYTWLGHGSYAVDAPSGTLYSKHITGHAVGVVLSAGLDLQLGSALVGFKLRYLLQQEVTGLLNSSNISAVMPQLNLGWAF